MRRALPVFFALMPAFLPACASEGSNSAVTGGSGGLSGAGGATSSGTGGTSSGTSGRNAGGQSSAGSASVTGGTGGSGGRGAAGRASGGTAGQPGAAGTDAGGRSSQGGAAANGGTSAGSAGGASGPAMGGSSASAGRGAGGAAGTAGAQNGGGAGTSGAAGGGAVSAGQCPNATWKLAWGDDFDGASGTAVDGSKWTYDSGPNWYNGELQYYSSGTGNASLDGNGNLVIEARKETREGRQYTSARLKTEGKKTFTYGRFEGRMKLPYGQGMWPAFWMLGGNSWPNTGEIDIMENLGREPTIAHGTMHGPGYSGTAGPTASYTLPGGAVFSDDFHVFAIEWEANAIRWYVDDELYSTKTPSDISGKTWVFDHGFFFILNLAVGGDWPGDPDATTVFPQRFVIDYVRVCQK